MCMEDIRLGRSLSVNPTRLVTVAAAQLQIADQDAHRTRLIIASDGTDVFRVFAGRPNQAITGAWTLTAETPAVVLRVEDWGKMVQGPWSIIAQGLGGSVWITEATLEKQ